MKTILFVCVENSARSQMAEGFFNFYNKNREFSAESTGTSPASEVKPLAVKVMAEIGVDLTAKKPRKYSLDQGDKAYKVITMGCMDSCPLTPPGKTFDWDIADPAVGSVDEYRKVRDEIKKKVKELIATLQI